MPVKIISLSIAAALCFAAAYRFGSHGLRLHDNKCIGLAVAAIATGLVLLWFAFRKRRPKHQ
jgi:membrane protein DedA with SNARE-associated domain